MITKLQQVAPKQLPGTTISYLQAEGGKELALVSIEPNGTIPLHSHGVDAEMAIVAGSARVLSDDSDNDKEVHPGDCVLFEKNRMHGFTAGPDGLTFISRNDGIRQPDGTFDLVFAE